MKLTVQLLWILFWGNSVIAATGIYTANFDSLDPSQSCGSPYLEGGVQFTSPNGFSVVNGSFQSVLFGGGGPTYPGNSLRVINNGWVGISVPGSVMTSVNFKYGFDWNFFTIEYGLMDTTFEWQTLLEGNLVGTGSLGFGRDNRTHGGFYVTVNSPPSGFDQLLIRSTAIEYQALPGTGSWHYDRGEPIGYGNANHIAFDNVTVQLVPEANSASLFVTGLLVIWKFRKTAASTKGRLGNTSLPSGKDAS